MATRDKGIKCLKVVKDGVHCSICDCFVHTKSVNVSDDCVQPSLVNKNLKWFCDGCLRIFEGHKNLSGVMTEGHNRLLNKINEVVEDS